MNLLQHLRAILGQKPTMTAIEPEARTYKNHDHLSAQETSQFRIGHCPDCGDHRLIEGPHGGGCINVYCGNERCGSRFNEMGLFGVDRISDAAIPKRPPTQESAGVYR